MIGKTAAIINFGVLLLCAVYFTSQGSANGAECTLAWDANSETNLCGYYIHYKTDPNSTDYYGIGADQGNSPIRIPINDPNHPNYIDPDEEPEFTLTGLDDDLNYYFALTAYNSKDISSDFSNEVALVQIISPAENFAVGPTEEGQFYISGHAPPGVVDVYAVDGEGEKLLGMAKVENDRTWSLNADFLASGVSEGFVGLAARSGEIESDEVLGTYGVVTHFSEGSDSGGWGGTGCFIATAAYGSYFEPHVEILKEFRDRNLLRTKLGHAFVRFYYRHSPPIADFIAEYEILKALARIGLMPLVAISYVSLNSHILLALIIMVTIGTAFRFTLPRWPRR